MNEIMKTQGNKKLEINAEMMQAIIDNRADFTYTRAVYQFGIIPVLVALANYEVWEDFEECELIKNAIKKINAEVGEELPTQYNNAAFDYIRALYEREKWDLKRYRKNLPEYCVECFNFCLKGRQKVKEGTIIDLKLNPYDLEFWRD